jgi:Zn-dependent membrane protease YugP
MRGYLWVGAWATLPLLFQLLVGQLYGLAAAWVDWRHPDTLPLTAGAWLREQIARFGLPVRVLPQPQPKSARSYFSSARGAIVLAQLVFYKPDPGAWAIAAHELGHARVHQRLPRLAALLLAMRRWPSVLTAASIILVGVNLLYGSPVVNGCALGLLVAALALVLAEILDEALASRDALRLLDEDGRLDGGARRSARFAMGAALATYAAAAIGTAGAIASFGWVRAIVEARRFAPGAPLDFFGMSLAFAGTVFIVVRLGYAVARRGEKPLGWWWDLPVVGFAAVVWDQPGLMPATLLAAISAGRLVTIAALPFFIAAAVLASLVYPRGRPELSEAWSAKVAAGQTEIEAAREEIGGWPTAPLRWYTLGIQLLSLPLVIQFWLGR